ncbi:Calcium-binding 39 [Micractinium conductrix]|uniref:Calcium-binding 39 n=1 Tax=Micractinium conductrix TaxID=554055 RepID=A0A2P6VFZ1_9CHLO|nr:Calcium-binding 39 [Micractinium conductrix]|eukprot:PSC72997.1 Calcium-binding 39 [Micractinium conductrix]
MEVGHCGDSAMADKPSGPESHKKLSERPGAQRVPARRRALHGLCRLPTRHNSAMAGRLLQRLRTKEPAQLVQQAHQAFTRLPFEANPERVADEIAKLLHSMKEAMFGEEEEGAHSNKDAAVEIAKQAAATGLLTDMVTYLGMLEFESRKDLVTIFGALVRIENNGDMPGLRYILENDGILVTLFDGYDDAEVALQCGAMFRDCIRHEPVARLVLESPLFPEMFSNLELSNFEVASDVFATFKDLLTRHKSVVAQFLADNYADFFKLYTELLRSDNYVTRRQSLKLLGELLLDRSNVKIMMQYVADVDNLCLMMNLLKDPSRSIQFEAFHVFKVFVANPNKTRAVVEILYNNRDKLLKYLDDFHNDRDDEQFKEEKAVIIKEISLLHPPPPAVQ